MSLVNNFFELRSDAFKMTHLNRRPLPIRTDSIGPWLESLNFLTWLSTLTNSALVYLFRSRATLIGNNTTIDTNNIVPNNTASCNNANRVILFKAVLIALAASHGYIIVRVVVRHLVEKIVWDGCKEKENAERNTKNVKEQYLKRVSSEAAESTDVGTTEKEGDAFWSYDEGLDEIRRVLKDA